MRWNRQTSGSVTVYRGNKEFYSQSGFKTLEDCANWIELQKEKIDNIDEGVLEQCSFSVSWGDNAICYKS